MDVQQELYQDKSWPADVEHSSADYGLKGGERATASHL